MVECECEAVMVSRAAVYWFTSSCALTEARLRGELRRERRRGGGKVITILK